jgi:poly-gamma-glutamate synthesis protein (capsule biosynthesis protein)
MTKTRMLALTALLLTGATQAKAQDLRARIEPIPDAMWRHMQGRSWRADMPCPARGDLVVLHAPYRDFQRQPRMGVLVVARSAAPKIAQAFQEIFDSGQFQIAKMRPIDDYNGSDDASMDDNNTSAFNCRRVEGGKGMSKHALGLAVDINPIQNPYRDAAGVAPRAGAAYATTQGRRAPVMGLIRPDDVVMRAFRRIGWRWGGHFRTTPDYQHFYQ